MKQLRITVKWGFVRSHAPEDSLRICSRTYGDVPEWQLCSVKVRSDWNEASSTGKDCVGLTGICPPVSRTGGRGIAPEVGGDQP